MNRRALAATALVGATLAACEIVQPDLEVNLQPAIVIEGPLDYQDIFDDVTIFGLFVALPDGTVRDTVLNLRARGQTMRARIALRPDEMQAGTQLAVVLGYDQQYVGAIPLFAGILTLDRTNLNAQFGARVRVQAIADLELGVTDTLIAAGQQVRLGDLRPIVFLDGRARRTSEITWASRDTSVVRMSDQVATGRAPGTTFVVAAWQDQLDSVRIDVDAEGTIVITPTTSLTHVVEANEILRDTLLVRNGQVGDIGTIDVTVSSQHPWLSASVSPSTLPSQTSTAALAIAIDGALLPQGGATGQVVVGSSRNGVTDVVITVQAFTPSGATLETRTWSPICTFGGYRPGSVPGQVACATVRARAWNDGNVKRVIVEVENLLGSRGDSLDVGNEFILRGFGIQATGIPGGTLIGVRKVGAVGVVGQPKFDPHTGSGYLEAFGQFNGNEGATVGCSAFGWPYPRYSTCDPAGETGYVRADFQVPGTNWSLATADPVLHVQFPGLYGKCGWPNSDCQVVP